MSCATCGARRPIPTRPAAAAPPPGIIRALLPRLQAAVHHPRAGSLGHVDPGVALLVPPRGARARAVGGLAVVLARLGDAEALLVLELRGGSGARLGGSQQRQREGGDH